ncbi:MAG: hypothetical protein ACOYOE_10960, partial [Chlorobium sp.]
MQLKIGDISQYASALGDQMNVVFEDTTLPVAKQITCSVFSIHEKLEPRGFLNLSKKIMVTSSVAVNVSFQYR